MSESNDRDPLAGCVGKVNRARFHLNALNDEFGDFVNAESKPWGFVSGIDPETGNYTLRVRKLLPLPLKLSLIVGDFAHNLRGALDHLVWQLVIANGRRPRGNFFPIFDQEPQPGTGEYRSWKKAVKGLSDDMAAFIESCQPYSGEVEGVHVLTGLRNLSNQDKHRIIVSSHAAIKRPSEGFTFEVESRHDVGTIRNGELSVEASLTHGDVVAKADAEVTGPNPEIKLKGNLSLEIAFGDDPWIAPMRGLEGMMNGVATIVQSACDPWFDGEPRWLQDEP